MSEDVTTRPDAPATEARSGSGSSGFLAVLLGGFIAGGVGYVAAYYTEFELFEVEDGRAAEVERLSTAFDDQAARLATLEESAAAAPPDEVPEAVRSEIGSVAETVAAISQRLDELQATAGTDDGSAQQAADGLAEIQERLSAVEQQAGDPGATETDESQSQQLAELSGRLDELSQTIEAQAETIDAQQQTMEKQAQAIEAAESAARRETSRISAQGAISEIRAALERGEAYADAIGEIEGTSDVALPEALSAPAGAGVSSLSDLQESFPGAAREALSASVAATAGGGVVDRFGAFLRSQTGARSLGEKEGGGADAILSRAEARLGEGQIDAALAEVDMLPDEGRQAMSGWVATAQERLDALRALADLSQSVNSI